MTPDTMRKRLPCLGCGKMMWTDRCHRICKKCRRRIEATPVRSPYLVTLPRGFELHGAELCCDRDEW
jgi:hypothetical protein